MRAGPEGHYEYEYGRIPACMRRPPRCPSVHFVSFKLFSWKGKIQARNILWEIGSDPGA